MPKNSQDSMLQDWEMLLQAVRENEAALGGVAPLLEALERAYLQAKSDRSTRSALLASTQEATQRLLQSLAEGKDAASCLRSFIKGVRGFRAEELRAYGIKPTRRRRGSGRTSGVGYGPPS